MRLFITCVVLLSFVLTSCDDGGGSAMVRQSTDVRAGFVSGEELEVLWTAPPDATADDEYIFSLESADKSRIDIGGVYHSRAEKKGSTLSAIIPFKPDDLKPEGKYRIRVISRRKGKKSAPTYSGFLSSYGGIPRGVAEVTAERGDATSIDLTWKVPQELKNKVRTYIITLVPKQEGGIPITRKVALSDVKEDGDKMQYTVYSEEQSVLEHNTDYRVKIAIETMQGRTVPVRPKKNEGRVTTGEVRKSPPDMPRRVHVRQWKDGERISVHLTWMPPFKLGTNDRGLKSQIMSYVVRWGEGTEATDARNEILTTTPEVRVRSLEVGKRYVFVVRARTESGQDGSWSNVIPIVVQRMP